MQQEIKEKLILTLINSRRKRWNFKPLEKLENMDSASRWWAHEDIEAIVKALEEK